jgi:protein disulfide-isomerase A1
MLYDHGVPMKYQGPRKADLLVRYLKKFVDPDVACIMCYVIDMEHRMVLLF